DDLAVDLHGDAHRPLGQAVQEVDGAVDRVDDPADPPAAGAEAVLLPEDGVVRPGLADPAADQLLGGVVQRGHHVGRARLGLDDLRAPWPLGHEHVARLLGDGHGEVEQLASGNILIAHPAEPTFTPAREGARGPCDWMGAWGAMTPCSSSRSAGPRGPTT